MKRLIVIILFLMISAIGFAQSEIVRGFKGDSCDYDLFIYSDGKFIYSRTENPDSYKELKSKGPILSIDKGDTLWLSTNGIIEVETVYAGNWKLRNDTIILSDTTWPKANKNWKICYVKMPGNYSLQNINLPHYTPNSILYLISYEDKKNNLSFWGKIKNGIINGEKWVKDANGNTIFIKKYMNERFSENEFLNK